MPVMLDHAVGKDAIAGHALGFGLEVGPDVHAGRVPPQEERLLLSDRALHEIDGAGQGLLVYRLHTLARQWARVLDLSIGG